MKAEGEIQCEGKIRIHFRCVKHDAAFQSINKDVKLASTGVVMNRALKTFRVHNSRSPLRGWLSLLHLAQDLTHWKGTNIC